jgi:hypothetical protein
MPPSFSQAKTAALPHQSRSAMASWTGLGALSDTRLPIIHYILDRKILMADKTNRQTQFSSF